MFRARPECKTRMADAVLDPNSNEALAALSEKRIAALRDGNGSKSAKGEATKEPAASEATGAKAATPDQKSGGTPDGDSEPNLSHIPEKYRSVVSSLPPEVRDGFLEWTKGGTVRHTDVAKFKKEAETLAEKAKALEAKAALWDDFSSDKRRVDALLAYNDKLRKQAAADIGAEVSEDDDVPDYPNMTPKEIEAHIRKVAAKAASDAAAKARKEALEDVEAKYVAPLTRVQEANLALAQYAKEHGYTAEDIQTATKRAVEYHEKVNPTFDRKAVTADTVIDLVEPFLSLHKGNGSTKKTETPTESARVATPPRSAMVAPSPLPSWQQEGRAPNRGERLGAIAATIERMYGRKVTESQVRDVIDSGV